MSKKRGKEEKKKKDELFERTIDDLKNEYKKIDKIKENNNKKSEKERLDNLF